jgi:hypothetical protein
MSRVDQQFAELMQMLTDEAKDGPRLFSFKPVEPGFFDRPKWISASFKLPSGANILAYRYLL